jgi:hypothetical protein
VSGVQALKGGRVHAEVAGKCATWTRPWRGAGGSNVGVGSEQRDPRISENG